MQTFVTESAEQTEDIGVSYARNLLPGDVIALFGDLGAGKTTFVRGVCRGLGITEDVSSPTFTLINEYGGQLPVYHFDFYRISAASEAWELGCDEYFEGDGICLIEWPERIYSVLPVKRRDVYLRILLNNKNENTREIRILDREDAGN